MQKKLLERGQIATQSAAPSSARPEHGHSLHLLLFSHYDSTIKHELLTNAFALDYKTLTKHNMFKCGSGYKRLTLLDLETNRISFQTCVHRDDKHTIV